MKTEALAEAALRQAKENDLCLVTAESCTAGAVALALSKAPGAGTHLHGGFITYTKEMKTAVLGVPHALLREKTAVCAEVAEAMARGALDRSGASVAVAVTGVAGPERDEDDNPVGLVYCCSARTGREPIVTRHLFEGKNREQVLQAAVEETLALLCRASR